MEDAVKGDIRDLDSRIKAGMAELLYAIGSGNTMAHDVSVSLFEVEIGGLTYKAQVSLSPNPDMWATIGKVRFSEKGVIVKEQALSNK